jgi:hypothetical protein
VTSETAAQALAEAAAESDSWPLRTCVNVSSGCCDAYPAIDHIGRGVCPHAITNSPLSLIPTAIVEDDPGNDFEVAEFEYVPTGGRFVWAKRAAAPSLACAGTHASSASVFRDKQRMCVEAAVAMLFEHALPLTQDMHDAEMFAVDEEDVQKPSKKNTMTWWEVYEMVDEMDRKKQKKRRKRKKQEQDFVDTEESFAVVKARLLALFGHRQKQGTDLLYRTDPFRLAGTV